jgi:hypothetical protein
MKNLLGYTLHVVDPETHRRVLTIRYRDEDAHFGAILEEKLADIPVSENVQQSIYKRISLVINGLPSPDDPEAILVSRSIAGAMVLLNLKHRAGVYVPRDIVWQDPVKKKKMLGCSGLAYIAELSGR